MTGWASGHAIQVLAAYDVLRRETRGRQPDVALYAEWYAARSPMGAGAPPRSAPVAGLARAAHAGASSWSRETAEVVAIGMAGVAVVATPQGRRALCRGDYLTVTGRPGFPPRVGDRVRCIERLGAVAQEGWWRTWGPRWNLHREGDGLIRVYLRPAPGRLAEVVGAVTGALTESTTWMLKVASRDEDLTRPDAAVVYLGGHDREALRDLVAGAGAAFTTGAPPPLTAVLAGGVGWAEDPGTGQSFGEVRCEAIAAAYAEVVALESEIVVDHDVWLNAVAVEFRSRGLDPGAPHVAARSRIHANAGARA